MTDKLHNQNFVRIDTVIIAKSFTST